MEAPPRSPPHATPAQQAEQLPLAVMRCRQLEAHAPWQENAPPYSSGWHLAFLLLGKKKEKKQLHRYPCKKAHRRLAIQPLRSPLLLLHPFQRTLTARFSPGSMAISSLSSPSLSRTCNGSLSPRVNLDHPRPTQPAPHFQPSPPPWPHWPPPSHGLAPSCISTFLQTVPGVLPLSLQPQDFQEKGLYQHSSLSFCLHPKLPTAIWNNKDVFPQILLFA